MSATFLTNCELGFTWDLGIGIWNFWNSGTWDLELLVLDTREARELTLGA
jgi:hypothetical protein